MATRRMYVLEGPASAGNIFGYFKSGLIPAGRFAIVSDGEYSSGGRGPCAESRELFASREAAEAELRRIEVGRKSPAWPQ